MSYRTFANATYATEFLRGVMVGYWWRPVSIQDDREGHMRPKPPTVLAPAHSTRVQVSWHGHRLIDLSLHRMTARDLTPLIELCKEWGKDGA
jgi:hypothetical protein